MRRVLFQKEWKSNYKVLIIFLALLAMYCSMITAMFDPELGESLDMMAQSMPELFAAFQMENAGTTMLDFLINYLYGFLVVVIPMIFTLILASKLVVRYVDKGSMAYLLTSGNSRRKIIVHQALFLLHMIVLVTAFIVVVCGVCSHLMFPGELEYGKFLRLNAGLLALHIFFGGLCFFLSCICNESGKMLGIAGGIMVWSIVVLMLSGVGEKLDWLKYLTPLTLFLPQELAKGEGQAVAGALVLLAAGVIGFLAGIVSFCRRDLFL